MTEETSSQLKVYQEMQHQWRVSKLNLTPTLAFAGDVMNRIWLLTTTHMTPVRLIPHDNAVTNCS